MRIKATKRTFMLGATALVPALLAASGVAAQTSVPSAQTPDTLSGQTASNTANSSDEVIVTGSRGLQRTRTDSPTPVDVISGAELGRTGKTGVLSALNALVPSFNEPNRAGGGTASIISTGGLRGLNPDQTLILVNGKRRHKTSLINVVSSLYNGSVPADLDLIPVSAIDHIEVLRDGAAAKYGSDAIAGVINIILKKNTSGLAGSFTGGQNMNRHDGQLFQGELSLAEKLGDNGFIDFFAQGKKQETSNRAVPIDPSINLYNTVAGARDPREATADRLVTKNYGAFPQNTYNLGYNAQYQLGGVELYSFGTLSFRRSDLNSTFRAPNAAASLPERYPDGFRPDEVIHETDFEGALGARGTLSGWNWDLSSTYGSNLAHLYNINSINASLGPSSPTRFFLGTLKSTEWVNSLDVTRGYPVGAGNLQVSGGVQHRLETYDISAGEFSSYAAGTYVIPVGQGNAGTRPAPGAQGAAGIQPTDATTAHRNNLAAYVDLTFDPSKRLTLDAAGRFEHYDDSSGNTLIGEGSARFAVTKWLALRGAVSTGFRAPSLAQQIYASTTGQFRLVNGVSNLLMIKTLPVGSPAAIALGAQPLKPEKSNNYSAGIVLTPVPALSITADAYEIDVRDRIAITGTLTGAAVSAILVANGQSPDISAQYYTNAIDTRTRGVDVVAAYRLDLGGAGQMRFNLGFNYNQTDITRIVPNPSQLSALGAGFVLFDRVAQGNLTTLLPTTKIVLGDTWTLSKFTLTGKVVRYGSYVIPQTTASLDRYFGAKWIADGELAFQATRIINIAVGANNLFNTYPDANGVASLTLGSQQYGASPPSPFGFTGGYYYGRISFAF